MFSTQIQNDDKYQAESYAERKLAESKNPSFWCFNALVPIKVAANGFVKLQFALDVGLSLLCLVLFFFVGSLLKVIKTLSPNPKGIYWFTFAAFFAIYMYLIVCFVKLRKELKKDGADKKIKVGTAVDRYNLARAALWAVQACYFAIFSIFFIRNAGSDSDFVYQGKRTSAMRGYIFGTILVTLFCIFQIMLVAQVSPRPLCSHDRPKLDRDL